MRTKFDGLFLRSRFRYWLGQTQRRNGNHVRTEPYRRAEWQPPSGSQERREVNRGSIDRGSTRAETVMHRGPGNLLLLGRELMMEDSLRDRRSSLHGRIFLVLLRGALRLLKE